MTLVHMIIKGKKNVKQSEMFQEIRKQIKHQSP